VLVEHPIQPKNEEEVRALAREAIGRIVERLVRG